MLHIYILERTNPGGHPYSSLEGEMIAVVDL